uniref:NADH-ubiquinone oxidoreductase chain 3 n=1 Tax=Lepas anserifera TaxID=245079 RepID=A0A0C5C4F7_9CRUS|nr:NADH dehydrogenase subunit 3 [Lepas anserifera]AJN90587.1 NADH dehydrogenase subunit 3 [Lepas anserifera]
MIYLLILSFALAAGLSSLLLIISSLLSKKSLLDQEKSSPFECGFDPKNTSRIPFSIRFFLIAIIFLVFDIEISILLPLGIVSGSLDPVSWLMVGGIFLGLVTLGLYYEWLDQTLSWIS